jgi:methionyl-tRNA synthetase
VPEAGDLTEADRSILATADGALQRVTEAIDEFAIHRALEVIWALVADANRYFAGEEPWAHKKTNTKRMETILYVTAEVTRRIAILVQPVMPDSAGRLLDQLGVGKEDRDFAALLPTRRLTPGTELPAPQAVFPRHVEAEENPAA